MDSKISTFILALLSSIILNAQVTASFSIDQTEGCGSLTVNFTNESIPIPIDSLTWNFGNDSLLTVLNPAFGHDTSYTYSPGTYNVSITAHKDGASYTKTKVIHVYPYPNANFTSEYLGYPGLQDTFYFSNRRYLFIAQYPNDTNRVWSIDGASQFSIIDSMGFNFKTIGAHQVTHTITINGCTSTSSQSITIKDSEEKIPNVFTPNNDGINDVFYVQTDGEMTYKFTVLNRFGSRVFISEGKIISWDGYTYWGELLSPGTYYYILEPSQGEVKKGSIYLSR